MELTWDSVSPAPGHDFVFSIGDLEGRLVGGEKGMRIHLDGRALAGSPDLRGWRDVSLPPGHTVRVVPRTPDLPVVLRSSELIELASNAKVSFEVYLPLWIQLVHTGRPERKMVEGVLDDVPSVALKRSWFGNRESGEVAYSWRFTACARQSYQRHFLTVPVSIVNRSNAVLRFESFLLRVIHLSVFSDDDRLVTNGVTVVFKGTEQLSQISFENDDAILSRGGIRRSGPRESSSSDIIRRSFSWLRELAG